jgi:hypothetical protein
VRIVDVSAVTLPNRTAAALPPSDNLHGRFKGTATGSVLEDLRRTRTAHVTDAGETTARLSAWSPRGKRIERELPLCGFDDRDVRLAVALRLR